MITFNTYMTQFTCSNHGILIRGKITTYLDTKGKSKNICFLCEQLIQTRNPDLTRGKIYERVKLFSIQRNIGYFNKDFYIKKIEKIKPTTAVTKKYLENIMLLTLDINNLNPHQITSVTVQIMLNDLAMFFM